MSDLIDEELWAAGRRRALAMVTAQQGDDDGELFRATLDGLVDGVEVGACLSLLAAIAWASIAALADVEGTEPDEYWQRFAGQMMEAHDA